MPKSSAPLCLHRRAMLCALLPLAASAAPQPGGEQRLPHILLMLADDLGFSHVGWRNSDVQTPHLDGLMRGGVHLDRHYAYQFCAPSRASLMSGRYPLHVQEDMNPYWSTSDGVPPNMTKLPEMLRNAGYRTHHVGKWHLGAAMKAQLPIHSGFDTSFGFLDGMGDHWNHRMQGANVSGLPDLQGDSADQPGTEWSCWGNALPLDTCFEQSCYGNLSTRFDHDLWRDHAPADHAKYDGRFSQDIYEEEIVSILRAHPAAVPLFLYMAFQLVHGPVQPPQHLLDRYNATRLPFLGLRKAHSMVSALDDSIGRILDEVRARGMWERSLVVFSSDNGGPLGTQTNWPLRGGKFSDWEGGYRVQAFVSGGFLPERARGTASDGYIMLADWWVTLTKLAGLEPVDKRAAAAGLPPVDGLDMWPMLSGANTTSPRTTLPLSKSALIVGEWKLIKSDTPLHSTGYSVWSTLHNWPPDLDCFERGRHEVADCSGGCLFNVRADPGERNDLAKLNASAFRRMLGLFEETMATMWHNCDPPSTCPPEDEQGCCRVYHAVYGDTYGPCIADTEV